MSVVLRCPNCGTTRSSAGECEACHEARVRYFCTNHAPGLWLNDRTCPSCAAAFADEARPARVVPGPTSRLEATRSPLSEAALPARASARPSPAASGSGPPERHELAAEFSLAPWQRLLSTVLRAGAPSTISHTGRSAIGGCLRRFVFMVLLLALALGIGVFMLVRTLFHAY